ncbi:hypothetical protein [Sphingomonas sp. LH128]|uniref:hypothetical protein n=1 Tax=Sphingomonas sp. LH128 TaxID=473781 RepID=UPI00031C2BA5|nr:hypothetical protein [Sphingomonas sp. LH128]
MTCRFSRMVRRTILRPFGEGGAPRLAPMSRADERELAELHRRREQRRRDREGQP